MNYVIPAARIYAIEQLLLEITGKSISIKTYLSWGNTKLPDTTAILNITTAENCPSKKLGFCALENPNRCYARKAEIQYRHEVLPHRNFQAKIWDLLTAEQLANLIKEEISRRKKPTYVLRLNECGDFKDQYDVDKAIKLTKALPELTIYCYTARKDLDFSKRDKLIVNGSGFMIDNKFVVVPKIEKQHQIVCRMDCSICNMCKEKKGRTIYVKLH